MKTAKILKKSVLKPGKNWITLLNSANLSKKNAVTPVNFHLYHYAANNPVRYTDPDGRLTILDFSKMSYTSITTEMPTIYGFPLGGDWSSTQKEILKLQKFANLLIGLGEIKGCSGGTALSFMQGLTFEGAPENYWDLAKSLVSAMIDGEKPIGGWISVIMAVEEFMECLAHDPSVDVTNYTSSHVEFLAQVLVEQKFINELCLKLEQEGIFSVKTYDDTQNFILNVEFITNSSCFADNVGRIKKIAEELKNSNLDLYRNVEIK